MIAAFKPNEKSLGPGTRFRGNDDLSLSQAKPFRKSHHFVYVRSLILRDALRSNQLLIGMIRRNFWQNLKKFCRYGSEPP